MDWYCYNQWNNAVCVWLDFGKTIQLQEKQEKFNFHKFQLLPTLHNSRLCVRRVAVSPISVYKQLRIWDIFENISNKTTKLQQVSQYQQIIDNLNTWQWKTNKKKKKKKKKNES